LRQCSREGELGVIILMGFRLTAIIATFGASMGLLACSACAHLPRHSVSANDTDVLVLGIGSTILAAPHVRHYSIELDGEAVSLALLDRVATAAGLVVRGRELERTGEPNAPSSTVAIRASLPRWSSEGESTIDIRYARSGEEPVFCPVKVRPGQQGQWSVQTAADVRCWRRPRQ